MSNEDLEFEDVVSSETPYPIPDETDNENACLVDYRLERDCPGQNGTTYDRLRLTFETESVDPNTGRHFYVSRPWSNNLGRPGSKRKTKMREMLETWLDRKLTSEELMGFSWRDMIGRPCRLGIVHVAGATGGTYANIDVVKAPVPGQEYHASGEYVRPVPSEDDEAPF